MALKEVTNILSKEYDATDFCNSGNGRWLSAKIQCPRAESRVQGERNIIASGASYSSHT